MHLIMEEDEARSLLAIVTSYILDNSDISRDAKASVRQWRTDHAEGTVKMETLTGGMNEAVGAYMDAQTDRQVRQGGRYGRVRSQK